MDLYDKLGHRKYLTPTEWRAFMSAAEAAPDEEATTFCLTLAFTGCRISEALQLTKDRADLSAGLLIFRTLKKRHRTVYRAVPVPPAFLQRLARVHSIGATQGTHCSRDRIWNWSRATAYRRIVEVMEAAGIAGMHATPKGLRHGFGIRAVASGVPLNMTQKWLGHAQISTTAIYADATGPEEQLLAARMWA